MSTTSVSQPGPQGVSAAAKILTTLLVGAGLVFRVLPLFDHGGRLLRQFPSEDGYLMLTIARNLALGNGMSIAEGTIPTNGTQPLVSFLWSLGFLMSGGDRQGGVLFALACQVLIAVVTAWLVWRLGVFIWRERSWGRSAAAIGAAAWFASPQSLPHTMNCLETGAYALVAVLLALAFLRADGAGARSPSLGAAVGLGALLGIAFWVRNDAVFLIAAACLTHWFVGASGRLEPTRRGLFQALLMGATSVVIASPWLIFNQTHFGSVVPISGTSQSFEAGFASNLSLLPVKLLEYAIVILGIPLRFEANTAVVVVGAVASVAMLAAALWILVRSAAATKRLTALVLLFSLGLVGYYGFLFGAPHFLGRYLFPLSPFIALLVVGTSAPVVARTGRVLWVSGLALAVVLVLAQNVRIYALGSQHMHFQVVEWVDANVPDEQWVAAVQTGTLGFFHDRTINLDGKVNPEALEARREDRLFEYILESEIEVIADWYGISSWGESSELAPAFEVVVADPDANLAVLKRRR